MTTPQRGPVHLRDLLPCRPLRRSCRALVVVAASGAVGCAERVPSELRPGFDSLVLDANYCGVTLPPVELLLRNVGDDPVTISDVAFATVAGHEGDVDHFDAPALDQERLLADEAAFVRFTYATPGGTTRQVELVVTSDASVNPTLVIPTATIEFLPADEAERARVCGEGDGG
jgi:hypothetical protein